MLHPYVVGVGEPVDVDVDPRVEVADTGDTDLDTVHGLRGQRARQRAAQHVLEAEQPIAAPGQECCGVRIGKVGRLDLGCDAEPGERPLDLVQRRRLHRTTEA